MGKGKSKICGFLLLFAIVFGRVEAQFRFSTQVSSTKVGLNDPFQVNFVLENGSQVSGFEPPSFNGFQVLQSSQSNSVNDINGQVSMSMTYSYLLQAQSIGAYTIEGATARESGNKVESNPVTIDVVRESQNSGSGNSGTAAGTNGPAAWMPSPGGGDPDALSGGANNLKKGEDPMDLIRKNLFAKAEVDKTDVYTGEQITATYKLFTRLHTSSQVTKVPAFTGFSSHDIDIPNPVTASTEKVKGVSYQVFTIRKTMLFPLQSGTLELDPAEIHNSVRLYKVNKAEHNANDPFADLFNDPFFKDPFGNNPFGNANVSYQDFDYNASSPPVDINVKPLPLTGQPAGFGGAVGKFTVEASLDKPSLSTDDAGSLKITVSGSGNIDMIGAPKISFPSDFDSYDPKTTDHFNKNSNPFSGTRIFDYVFMPKSAGNYVIPPVSFSYFDPSSKSYKTILTQAFHIQATPGVNHNNTVVTDYSNSGQLQPLLKGNFAWTTQTVPYFGRWWFWTLLVLPVLLLIGMISVRTKQQNLRADAVLFKYKRANKVALKRLSLAARYLRGKEDKAFYDETSKAIWGYLSHKLNIPYASLNRETVQEALSKAGVNNLQSEKLFALAEGCEVALYSPSGGQARMQQTYEDALDIIGELESPLK